MNNKTFNILSVLCLIAVIGVMSWRDMHPKGGSASTVPMLSLTYFADSAIASAQIPDDNIPVTIDQGEFKYTPDGKTLWAHQGMSPVTLAQRQINLLLHFDGLPQDPAETLEKIQTLTDDWKHQGTGISLLVVYYHPQKPNLKAYTALIRALHNRFKESFNIIAMGDTSWLEDPLKTGLEPLREYSPWFTIALPHPAISPELLSKLKKFPYSFTLQFPAGVLPADIDMATLKKIGLLEGGILTLDPSKPLPKKEEKIGLFPKF